MASILVIVAFLLGALVSFGALVWTLILCWRQGVGWFLAVLLLPFANLIFLVKFWTEAKRPFFLSLAGAGLMMLPAILDPQGFSKSLAEGITRGIQQAQGRRLATTNSSRPGATAPSSGAPSAPPVLSENLQREQAALDGAERHQRQAQETRASFDKHRVEADALYKTLNARRAKLKVDDAAAVAAFNADAARYAALLEQARVEQGALDSAAPTAPVSAPLAAPTGPGDKREPVYVPGVVGGNPNGTKPAVAPGEGPGLARRSIDKARAARDAASRAGDSR